MNRRIALIVAALIGIVLVVTVPILLTSGHKSKSSPPPIVLVHGYALSAGCAGGDVTKYWGAMTTALFDANMANPVVPVAFYQCDTNGTNIDSFGDPRAYFASAPVTRSTDLRHLSYALAWFIYDTYSKNGQSVDVVAHSMGGLMIRWALAQVAAGNSVFPPYLLVHDAITVSTPFLGAVPAVGSLASCQSSLECAQFTSGSSFLNELDRNANPQGRGGTSWTVMGGGPCDLVSADSATAMDARRVSWTVPCYTHGGIIMDTSQAMDATTTVSEAGSSPVTSASAPHSLAAVVRTLQSN